MRINAGLLCEENRIINMKWISIIIRVVFINPLAEFGQQRFWRLDSFKLEDHVKV